MLPPGFVYKRSSSAHTCVEQTAATEWGYRMSSLMKAVEVCKRVSMRRLVCTCSVCMHKSCMHASASTVSPLRNTSWTLIVCTSVYGSQRKAASCALPSEPCYQ